MIAVVLGALFVGGGLALVGTSLVATLRARATDNAAAVEWAAQAIPASAHIERRRRSRSGRGMWTPWSGFVASRRRRAFEAELPSALDLVAGSLEAGAPLAHALELVASEGEGPLAEEFERALAHHRLGRPLIEALEESAGRVGSRDFSWCTSAIRAQQEFGASLATVFRTLAEFMRWREEIRGEVRALTAEGRLSAWVLGALPFVVAGYFALANPGYLGVLFTSPVGLMLLVFAGVFMTIGIVWMSRIVKVEV